MVILKSTIPSISQVLFHIGYLIPFTNYGWLSIVFWTLAIEFQFYLLYSFIFSYFNKSKIHLWLLAFIFLIISLCLNNSVYFLYWSPIFLLGIFLAFFKFGKLNFIELLISVIIISIIIYLKMGLIILLFSIFPLLLIFYELKINNSGIHPSKYIRWFRQISA